MRPEERQHLDRLLAEQQELLTRAGIACARNLIGGLTDPGATAGAVKQIHDNMFAIAADELHVAEKRMRALQVANDFLTLGITQ